MAYTGGLDGTVRSWLLPPPNNDPYDKYDARYLNETLTGHRDAVWSVAVHASDNRLVTASADGTIKLWEPGSGNNQPMLKSFAPPAPHQVPVAVDFVSTEPQQVRLLISSLQLKHRQRFTIIADCDGVRARHCRAS